MWLCGARQWRGHTGTSSEPARGTRGEPPPLYSRGGATLNACHSHHGMLLGQAGLAARDAWMAGGAVEAIPSQPQVAQLQHHNPTFLVHHAADSSLTSARDNCRGSCHCEDRGRRWADGAASSLWAKLHQSPHWMRLGWLTWPILSSDVWDGVLTRV